MRDPFHTVYLHTKAVRSQFIEAFAELSVLSISPLKLAISIPTPDAGKDIIWFQNTRQSVAVIHPEWGTFPNAG